MRNTAERHEGFASDDTLLQPLVRKLPLTTIGFVERDSKHSPFTVGRHGCRTANFLPRRVLKNSSTGLRSTINLLALLRFAEHQPVTVMSPGMVGFLPFGVDDWPLSYLDDAIASQEANSRRRLDDFQMCPLVTMVVNVINSSAVSSRLRPLVLPFFIGSSGFVTHYDLTICPPGNEINGIVSVLTKPCLTP